MRLRQTPWPQLLLATVVSAGFGLLIITVGGGWSYGSPADVFLGGPALAPLIAFLISWRRDDVKLRAEGFRRHREPSVVPWARVQAVALAGDTAGVCPTLWTDDGRERRVRR